jgi:hypothetical protein
VGLNRALLFLGMVASVYILLDSLSILLLLISCAWLIILNILCLIREGAIVLTAHWFCTSCSVSGKSRAM